MVESARKLIQSAVIDAIRRKGGVTYAEIGESIGVHLTHVQKVAKGARLLKEEKFRQLCERWGVDIDDITRRVKLDDMEYLRWKTLMKLMEAREVDLRELSRKTGISILVLNKIERRRYYPTAGELKKIAEVLEIDAQIIDEGRIVIALELIEKVLGSLHIPPTAVQAVIDFVESEI